MTGRCPLSRGKPGPSPFPTSGPLSWRFNTAYPSSTTKRPSPRSSATPTPGEPPTRSGSRTPGAWTPSFASLPNTASRERGSGTSCGRSPRFGWCWIPCTTWNDKQEGPALHRALHLSAGKSKKISQTLISGVSPSSASASRGAIPSRNASTWAAQRPV